MEVFLHHIYEYRKGLRNLVLHTMNSEKTSRAIAKLNHNKIDYVIHEVDSRKINIFFGDKECVDIIRCFGLKKLHYFTPEEDFILGIMLGYDRLEQCARYNKNIRNNKKVVA